MQFGHISVVALPFCCQKRVARLSVLLSSICSQILKASQMAYKCTRPPASSKLELVIVPFGLESVCSLWEATGISIPLADDDSPVLESNGPKETRLHWHLHQRHDGDQGLKPEEVPVWLFG